MSIQKSVEHKKVKHGVKIQNAIIGLVVHLQEIIVGLQQVMEY